jgi:hypothetical protein
MHPILNYVEFRTNHEPYMVHGVVHGGSQNEKSFLPPPPLMGEDEGGGEGNIHEDRRKGLEIWIGC